MRFPWHVAKQWADRQKPYTGHLDKALTREEAGSVARRLTDKHILDNETLKGVWDLMDTISILYMDIEYPDLAQHRDA